MMSDGGEKTCPLCTEEMDVTDQQLKPCKCGYEICVWCWHHIMDMAEKDDTEGRCPACRTPYDKEKIVGMAANCERLVAEINSERKIKSQKAKPKLSEGRKHLSSVRVIQRNLVYIIGIPSNLADEDLLQRKEYFGQYGKVLKVSISRTAGGAIQHSSNNTCSVYITYSKEEEAVRCIQSVHGFALEGRPLRACFGTTKYCHAWLRNTPCSNPDCLYLHDIGTQEDSFTKDEIISAYTRSRVQQITGATNNLQRRSGNVLPPPADDFCSSGIASSGKPIAKSASNNPITQIKDSPPNGSSGRSIALPAAASWGLRVSNGRPPTASSACSNGGPAKQKPDAYNGLLPSVTASTTQASTLHTDVGKKSMVTEESQALHSNGGLGSFESSKQYIVRDCRTTVLDAPAEVVRDLVPAIVSSSNHLSCLSASKDSDRGISPTLNITNTVELDRQACSSASDKDGNVVANGAIHSLCSGMSSIGIPSHLGVEHADSIKHYGSVSNLLSSRSPGNQGMQQYYPEHAREPQPSERAATAFEGASVSREPFDWKSESQSQVLPDACSDVEEDLLVLNEQRSNVSEVSTYPSYLPHSSNSLKISNHFSGHSWQQGDTCSTSNTGNADPRTVHTKVDDTLLPFTSSDPLLSNGYNENKVSGSVEREKIFERSNLFSNVEKGKYLGRFNEDKADVDKNDAVDMGESSIISNILSLDFDAWDDSLASPHHLAKLFSETDKQPGSIKKSSSWKVQNSNQSRFSFARQEDFVSQVSDSESSFRNIERMTEKYPIPQDSVVNRDAHLDKLRNGFSSSIYVESDAFPISHSIISSNKLSGSRAQISAPPGFTFPSRAPPPGFSSQERMDQAFDTISGNHLFESSSMLSNQYPVQAAGNLGSIGDVEFIDPAILAVGKGRPPNGINNAGFDMRSTFTPQLSASENDPRLQLLMQQSHQNLRFPDHIGDRFSLLSDAYRIPSRLLDQSQASNLTPFAQLSLQQSRHARMSNGHWDGWNEGSTGNDFGMAELLRNERLGYNKYIPSWLR